MSRHFAIGRPIFHTPELHPIRLTKPALEVPHKLLHFTELNNEDLIKKNSSQSILSRHRLQ